MGESLKLKLNQSKPKPVIERGSIAESLDLNTGFDAFSK